jgi:hypothetical protein
MDLPLQSFGDHTCRLKSALVKHSPHMLVRATSEGFLPARGTFRVILASESHWLQPVLVLSIHWWPPPTGVGRVWVHGTLAAMSTTLHILVGHRIVVGWRLVLIYTRTPPTHYYLVCSGQATYMKTHPKSNQVHVDIFRVFLYQFEAYSLQRSVICLKSWTSTSSSVVSDGRFSLSMNMNGMNNAGNALDSPV